MPVQATNGNLYGTTREGGVNVCIGDITHSNPHGKNIGCGTVFEITPNGTLTTLYNQEIKEPFSKWSWGRTRNTAQRQTIRAISTK